MFKYLCVLMFFVFSLLLVVWVEVFVYDGVVVNNGGNVFFFGYGMVGVGGVFVGGGVIIFIFVQGELFMQFQQMQDELVCLCGMFEEQQNQIQQFKQESLECYQDFDCWIFGGGVFVVQNFVFVGVINVNGVFVVFVGNNVLVLSSELGDLVKEKFYYDVVFDLIKSKDFDKVSQVFNVFLCKYLNSQYFGNVQYWFGEVNLVKGDL